MIDYIYDMNLRDLEYLVAVADTLHFGQAAKRVHVSQPTLSMQLKKLEETLGVQLFERSNRQVMLTNTGREIVARARRALDEVTAMKHIARAASDPLAGTLRIGLFPTLAPYLLPSLMPKLNAAFPKLHLLLIEEKTPELIHQLESGAIDCALLAMPVHADMLQGLPLFTEPFLLAMSHTHRLAERKNVKLADLAHENVLLLEDGHCLRDQALEVCQMVGIGEANNFRATSLETLRHMLAASDAVTLMPALATTDKDPHTRYVPFASPAPARTIGLYFRATSGRTTLFKSLQKLVMADYKKL